MRTKIVVEAEDSEAELYRATYATKAFVEGKAVLRFNFDDIPHMKKSFERKKVTITQIIAEVWLSQHRRVAN